MRRARALLAIGLLVAAFAVSSAAASAPADRIPAAPRRVALPARVPCPGCWHPGLRTSWQWQLGTVPRARDLLDVRMYDVDGFDARRRVVSAMHDRGIKAVCYVSAGAWENWRPDAEDFPAIVKGRSNGWPGERWLDVRRLDLLRPIMAARVAMCDRKGFDAVEFDNVDGYQNGTGFPLTGAAQLRYNVFLANEAHRHGLSALLKNDLGQIRRLVRYFDAALNEQCHRYDECGRLSRFVDLGKPVFGVEYGLETTAFCPSANTRNFNFLKKRLSLGAWRVPCRAAGDSSARGHPRHPAQSSRSVGACRSFSETARR